MTTSNKISINMIKTMRMRLQGFSTHLERCIVVTKPGA